MDEPTLTREQAWGWEELMVIAAFRYCLGRRTYIVETCADWVVKMWPVFSEKSRAIIKRDLEQAFGDDCDRKAWEKVRALWTQAGKAGE